jgi:hypothetical protein
VVAVIVIRVLYPDITEAEAAGVIVPHQIATTASTDPTPVADTVVQPT